MMLAKSAPLQLLLLASTAHAIDNGYGMLPPMGWRSWNCYGKHVNQSLMEAVIDKMSDRSRTVDGVPTSLVDLGYISMGLDDNWQACGDGVNGSFHDASGVPLVNTDTFPDMKAMTAHGHAKGMKVGWYANNCICKEKHFTDDSYIAAHMQETAKAAADFGFDGIKLDDCGQFLNLTWWAQLLNETGRPMEIENCHWGRTVPGQTTGDGPCDGDSGISDCPYNFYRTSLDIKPFWIDVMHNLFTTVKFLGEPPLSRPGSWAYPDMLEVGKLANHKQDRSHFAAWCIVSSPLILGYDLLNEATTDAVWDIISNKEVIAVSQTWAGHPGRHMKGDALTMQTWTKPLGDHDHAVLFLNANDLFEEKGTVDFASLGFAPTDVVTVRDLYAHEDLATNATGSFTTEKIKVHDSVFLRITLAAH
eukprot:TRINITY_DN606_c0_g1_i3.p2 TRINITY_DN606_c0_g1~~TRINITY_DN606_c0_g1_i3.p2  ORF type:complete len:418 (+),score=148.79 TRINITY_DN606_c0_g1_i3:47-1300(+)